MPPGPAALADASDACQIEEIGTARGIDGAGRGMFRMIEGPGHMPMDQIAAIVAGTDSLYGCAFLCIGDRLVTDIAPGYDHITSAIGGAIAAQAGAAFLSACHARGTSGAAECRGCQNKASSLKIAAHAADIAKGVRGAREIDDKWRTRAGIWTGRRNGHARSIRRRRGRSAMPGNPNMTTLVRCAEVLCGPQYEQGACGEQIDIL